MIESFITYHWPGERAEVFVGDILLTRGSTWYTHLIRFGQRLTSGREYDFYNHVAIVVEEDTLVEALGTGVEKTSLARYDDTPYAVVHTGLREPDHALQDGLWFLNRVLADRWRYAWSTIVGMIPHILSGGRIMFSASGGSCICSGLAAEFLVRHRGEYFPKNAAFMMPSELAQYYNAKDPF